jgi:hypothetical protein
MRASTVIGKCESEHLKDGEVCTATVREKKSVLRFGKIKEGMSDGTYKCQHWWKKYGKHKIRKRLDEYVNVIIKDLENVTKFTVTKQPRSVGPTVSASIGIDNKTVQISVTESFGSVISTTTVNATYILSMDVTNASVPDRVMRSNASASNSDISSISSTNGLKINITIIITATVSGGLIAGLLITVLLRSCRTPPPPQEGVVAVKDWEFPRSRLRFFEELGEGFFGTVHKAEALGILNNGIWSTVAIKMVNARDNGVVNKQMQASLREEAKLLCDLGSSQHENVIQLLGVCSQKGPLLLIEEYASGGNLKAYLRSLDYNKLFHNGLMEIKMVQFALQIARGMEYLIDKKIIHRDLAARNILVFDGEILKVCDFGMARDVRFFEYYRKKSPGVLPVKWMAPESLINRIYTESSDV